MLLHFTNHAFVSRSILHSIWSLYTSTLCLDRVNILEALIARPEKQRGPRVVGQSGTARVQREDRKWRKCHMQSNGQRGLSVEDKQKKICVFCPWFKVFLSENVKNKVCGIYFSQYLTGKVRRYKFHTFLNTFSAISQQSAAMDSSLKLLSTLKIEIIDAHKAGESYKKKENCFEVASS